MSIIFIFCVILLSLAVLWSLDWMLLAMTLLKIVAIMVPLLVFVLYLILAERKIMGYMQARVGPNRVGPLGSFQTLADGLKFLLKEIIIPDDADKVLFLIAPLLSLVPAFAVWSVIPYDQGWVLADIDAGVLFLFAMTSIGIYGVILAGWASNSKYAFFGGVRAMAQMISYEIVMGFSLIGVLMLAGSMNLSDIVSAQAGGFWHWYVWPLMPIFVVYWISALAEINRAPFDVVEGESEIVAGYQVEYSGFAFAMFFIAEYSNMILMACVSALFFWGGWYSPFEGLVFIDGVTAWVPGIAWLLLKTCLLLYLMIWLRSTLPRYRYDQIMMLVWKTLIPVTVFWLFVVALFIQGGWL